MRVKKLYDWWAGGSGGSTPSNALTTKAGTYLQTKAGTYLVRK